MLVPRYVRMHARICGGRLGKHCLPLAKPVDPCRRAGRELGARRRCLRRRLRRLLRQLLLRRRRCQCSRPRQADRCARRQRAGEPLLGLELLQRLVLVGDRRRAWKLGHVAVEGDLVGVIRVEGCDRASERRRLGGHRRAVAVPVLRLLTARVARVARVARRQRRNLVRVVGSGGQQKARTAQRHL
eukprot:scaffold116930_cov75-Phaeocystis_antarctica.AAC.2